MKIYIGADHRGFELKKELKKFLIEKGYEVEDAGAFKYDKDDDYPDFAEAVAEKVSKDDSARGILLCGSGTGMDAAANKVRGVRATLAFSKEITRAARNDDDVNVISLPADFLKSEEAEEIVAGTAKHVRNLLEKFRVTLHTVEDMQGLVEAIEKAAH